MSSTQIAVLGAGMAGMAAANTLRDQDCTVYEARSHSGGHASSFKVGAYTFDEGPHISFTKDERIRNFLATSVQNKFNTHPTVVTNYYQGHVVPHPIHCNLHGLPTDLVNRAIASFVNAHGEQPTPLSNYKDWCDFSFGETITETFVRPYMRKYWTLELECLSIDWVAARIHAPTLEQVLVGALSKASKQYHYMKEFNYPQLGGFGAYNAVLTGRSKIQYNHAVSEVNRKHKRITFSNGTHSHYEYLISSLPLPTLLHCLTETPEHVMEAVNRLICTSQFIVSLGIKRPTVNDAFWMCIYDENVPFARVSFPSKFAESVAPDGYSSIQVEVAYSRHRPIDIQEDSILEKSIAGLQQCGILANNSEIDCIDIRNIQFANVVFDLERTASLNIIHRYLTEIGIHWCGRYGDWAYHWTDQSMLSGERAANEVRTLLGLEPALFT